MASGASAPVVTLSALYGAGGSVVGALVAERLGVPFLDRQIPAAAARREGISEEALESLAEGPSGVGRIISTLGRTATIGGATEMVRDDLDLQERRIRTFVEEFIARAAASGGVVLGHGAMVVLRDSPTALHVCLQAARERRLRQAMAVDGIDLETATERQQVEDRARIDYVRRAYGVDGRDPSLYHLILDSTELPLDACADLIASASRARIARAGKGKE